jgi:uncharacterized protein YecE (DUF72 family)
MGQRAKVKLISLPFRFVKAMTGRIRIGCSGWIYRHWRELFYPPKTPQRLWYGFYAERFQTVELNTSFYHLPKPETFTKWRDQAPEGFRYAVKAPRFITHMKKLKECAEPAQEFLSRARNLGETIGPILYQLPPRWACNTQRLEEFIALLPPDLSHVFEFRETSWITQEVLALLDARGVSFCVHDMPGLETPRWAAGPIAYLRFHGGEGKYWGRYSDESLRGWAEWIGEQAKAGRDVWCYFNNDIGGASLCDAHRLMQLCGLAPPIEAWLSSLCGRAEAN